MNFKKIVILILTISFSALLSSSAHAANIDEYAKDSLEAIGADKLSDYLSDESEEYLERLGCEDIELERILDVSPKSIFRLLWEMIKNGFKEPLKGLMKVTGTVLLVSVCSGFFPDDEKSKTVLNLICGCFIVLSVFAPAVQSVKAAVSAIKSCSVFEKALIPVLAATVTASGNPTSALTFKSAAFAAAELIEELADNFALPLIGITSALGLSGAMLPTLRLTAISEILRKTVTTVLSASAGLFSGFLALKSLLSSSADSIAVKGVKLAANTFVPVVGGALGEAYTSVIGSISLLKGTVGIYAILALSVIGIPVIINLSMWTLAMRAACAVSDLLDCRVCSELLRNTAFVFSMTNTILILCLAVFIISAGLVVAVKTDL